MFNWEEFLAQIAYCQCNCGNKITIKKSHKWYGIPRYLPGHNPVWCKGLTKETDKRLALMAEKVSKTLMGHDVSEESKEKNRAKHLGKKQSKETIAKRVVKLTGQKKHAEKHKKELSERMTRDNPSHRPDSKNKLNKGKTLEEVYRKEIAQEKKLKLSQGAINRILRDGVDSRRSWFKRGYFYSDKNKAEIYYSSSYELSAYLILEKSPTVISYDRCRFSIKYFNPIKNSICRYLPDILVEFQDGFKEIIEVKAKYKILDPINQAKFRAAEDYCKTNNLKFIVWTEKELGLYHS